MQDQALSDVKVVDLSHYIAGPFCTKMLADFGAEVIKIEKPGEGDGARRIGPFPQDIPHPEKSGLFLHLNTNKKGITLNLKTKAGVRLFKELVREADILVESFAPRVMPSLGLSYEELEKINPRLVMTSVSNFGQTSPYRDYKLTEIVSYAMGGAMYATGLPDREPLKLGGAVGMYQAGHMAATATIFALYGAEVRGSGEHLDVSIMDTQAAGQDRRTTMFISYQYTGEVNVRRATGSAVATGVRPCKDGYVNIAGGGVRFTKTLQMMGMPELLEDSRFATPEERAKPGRSDEFDEYYLPWLLERSMRDVWRISQEAHLLSGPIYTSKDVLEDPHFRERDFWAEIDHSEAGKLTYTGAPFRMSETPWQLRSPAPLLGQHNSEIYCGRLGLSKEDLVKLREMRVI